MTFSEFWTTIKIRKWGKYVITLLVFLVVFLFIGDQSLIHFMRRGREIRHLEEQGMGPADIDPDTLKAADYFRGILEKKDHGK